MSEFDVDQAMSWYNTLVSTASSKVSNLQRSFLNSETDGDTEDDTHVCRVLRTYYTERGKPFPGWLPPDPKAPPPVAAVYSQPASQVGARYGAAASNGGQAQQQGGGGLSSLWDKTPAPQQQQQEVQSLRNRGRNAPPAMRGSGDTRQNPFQNSDPMGGQGGGGRDERPLPSQRGGSYQSNASGAGSPAPSVAGGGSAQDRLKQRLWGGGARTTSPSQSGPFNPPAQQQQQSGGSRPVQGGSSNYEDRFAPGGSYDNSATRRGAEKPFMAANTPWATNEDEFAMMGGGGGGSSGGRRMGGLPSGPRAYR